MALGTKKSRQETLTARKDNVQTAFWVQPFHKRFIF
jgi:hypothetical protein